MAGMRGFRRAAALVALTVSLVASGLAATGPAAAEGEPVITWPTSIRINPETATYEVQTTGTDPATDRFRVGDVKTPVDADGTTSVGFPAFDGQTFMVVILQRCTPTCQTLGISPYLDVRDRISVHGWRHASPSIGPHYQSSELSFSLPDVTAVHYEWEVFEGAYDPTSTPIASGTLDDPEPPFFMPPFGDLDLVQAGDPPQLYSARVKVMAATPWGPMPAEIVDTFSWDELVDMRARRMSPAIVYPVRDDFQDFVDIRLRWASGDDPQETALRVLDSSGAMVRQISAEYGYHQFDDDDLRISWDGRDDSGQLVPEGAYELELTARDFPGNAYQWRTNVEVSHRRRQWITWRRTFPANEVLIDKYIGRCAALRRPARPAWRGSLGYRSRSDCGNPEQSVVSTVHGAYIPYSYFDSYQLRVSVFGGKARGESRSRIALSYRSRRDTWVDGGVLDGEVELHHGSSRTDDVVLGQDETEPYVIWALGLGGGLNYDVKSFTIRVRCLALTY